MEYLSSPAIIQQQFLAILKPEQYPELPLVNNDAPPEPEPIILDQKPEKVSADKVLTEVEVVEKLSSSETESSGQICDQNRENPVRSRVNTLDLTGYKLRPAIRSDSSFIFEMAAMPLPCNGLMLCCVDLP